MNKKVFFNVFLGIVAAGMFLLTGCGKEEKTPDSTFTYDGKTYDLSHGLIMNDTVVSGQIYLHLVAFFSDGLTIHSHTYEGKEYLDSISGDGDAMVLYMVSDGPDGPADGTYNYSSNVPAKGVPQIFTWEGSFFLGVNGSDEEDGEDYDMTGGTIKVKNTGTNQYEFDLNATSDEQKEITAYVNLKLTPMLFDNKKKSVNLNFLTR